MTIQSVQMFFLQNKSSIIRVFYILEIFLVLMWLGGFYWYANYPESYVQQYSLGLQMGVISANLYMLTLIPGILGRFQILLPIKVVLMAFRRHLGITMFLSAFVHMAYTLTIPTVLSTPFTPAVLTTHQMFGFFAMLLLLPMWLTSNDFSVKLLGKKWQLLHRVTYIALVLIFLHVAWVTHILRFPYLALIVLEVLSWLYFWYKKSQRPADAVVAENVAKTNEPQKTVV